MKNKNNLLRLDLQLFSEGGDGGTGESGAMGVTGTDATSQNLGVKKGKSNPLSDVKYGIQEEETSAQTTDVQEDASTEIDLDAEFEKLIKGDYKDIYNQRVQDTVQKRLKGTKEITDKYESLAPLLEILNKKYGVAEGDIKALVNAVEEDDSYFEEEALEKGISVEELKRIRKIEKENSQLKTEMAEAQRRENAARLYGEWMRQAEEVKAIYPSFDLEAELQNPAFRRLAQDPAIGVRTAYEAIHHNDVVQSAMQFTAQKVEQKLANNIIAGGARPIENGNASQSASLTKSDVSQLTKADRDEIVRRVARGEKIRF